MDKFEINKDNYKGYVELYRKKMKMSDDQYKYGTKFLITGFSVFVVGMLTSCFIGLFAPVAPIIAKNIVVGGILLTIGIES